jgi:indole-3-glycerol phosphate synthase
MILDTLVAATRVRLAERMVALPEDVLRERVHGMAPPRGLLSRLAQPGVSIIAEVKRASPSRGALNMGLAPGRLALDYARGGADALSVLTEETRFFGSLNDLVAVRQALDGAGASLPLLRKDFIVDRYQLLEARLAGADAVLLIISALDDTLLADLYQGALDLGLTPLVEVHDGAELHRALALNPALIGINNRDLRDFSVSLETTRRLRPLIPSPCLVVSESGIHAPEQMRELAELRVDAALIGESLVTASDPVAILRALKEAGR